VPRILELTDDVAVASPGFDDRRADIILRTSEQGTTLRSSLRRRPGDGDPARDRPGEPSLAHLPSDQYGDFRRHLQSGPEPPGETGGVDEEA
jgi:hypothetical protein